MKNSNMNCNMGFTVILADPTTILVKPTTILFHVTLFKKVVGFFLLTFHATYMTIKVIERECYVKKNYRN